MTILVTGAAGMIGSNLCHWLINNTDHEIIGIDNLTGGSKENCPVDKRFRLIAIDVLSSFTADVFRLQQPSIVYHAAAYAAENLSPFIRKFNYTNNLVATSHIVNLCIEYNVKRLVFLSSIAVYGHGKPPFMETDIPVPNDPYGIAKYACELDIKVAGEQHGLDWCIVRPFNVYGVGQNIKDKYRNVLGIFMNQFLNKKPLTIFGDGSQVRCFTNVKDIMFPLYNAGFGQQHSKKVYNLGSNIKYTVLEAAKILMKIMGGGEIKYLESRHEVHIALANNFKCRADLGYADTTDLQDGLEEMFIWAKTKQDMPETIAPEYEINKGMYNAWKK